jgi:SPP1 gp7 family putative phage head morphogenesis protein
VSQILPGQTLLQTDFEPVEEGLRRFITDLLFRPLAQIWREEVGRRLEYENSAKTDRTTLLRSLRAGRVQYSVDLKGNGAFTGEFNATIGRALRQLGASFDGRLRAYRLAPERVPDEVLEAGAAHAAACERAHQRMEQFLLGAQGRLEQVVERLDPMTINAERTMGRVTSGFEDSVRRVGIPFTRPDAATRRRMSADYTQNMKLWIKKWTATDIVHLRRQVEQNARSGARAQSLASRIASRYEVAQSKARFLARQETGLFMAQYHKAQYTSVGVPRYVWMTSKDEDVRLGHQELQGRVFTWAAGAPAKYMSCGRPCNPHEDFQCRCTARPLVDTAYNARFAVGDVYVKEPS